MQLSSFRLFLKACLFCDQLTYYSAFCPDKLPQAVLYRLVNYPDISQKGSSLKTLRK